MALYSHFPISPPLFHSCTLYLSLRTYFNELLLIDRRFAGIIMWLPPRTSSTRSPPSRRRPLSRRTKPAPTTDGSTNNHPCAVIQQVTTQPTDRSGQHAPAANAKLATLTAILSICVNFIQCYVKRPLYAYNSSQPNVNLLNTQNIYLFKAYNRYVFY